MSNKPIPGHATLEGTQRFASRHAENISDHYRTIGELSLSDLGIGTYIGTLDEETDQRYTDAIIRAVERGINVIDTAINYRFQRSERSVAKALAQLIGDKKISRDEVVVCTKGGFIPYDNEPPKKPMDWWDKNLFENHIIAPGDIVADCHCIHPNYLRNQIQTSLENLGLETIDVYYLHNVETELVEISPDELEEKIRLAFEALEEEAEKGRIRRYGLATWDAFRVSPEEPQHQSLSRMIQIAHSVAGEKHHFKVIQFPFNFLFREAATASTQEWRGDRVPLLRMLNELDFMAMSNVPLLQGKLLGKLPSEIAPLFPDAKDDVHRALAFASSAPGISSTLVGMSRLPHVDGNTEYLKQRRLDPNTWAKLASALQ